jgi:cell filamentation protein
MDNSWTARANPAGEAHTAAVQKTAARMEELQLRPILGTFDYEHLRQIHEYLFRGSINSEPGQQRTFDIEGTTPGDSRVDLVYMSHDEIDGFWEKQHDVLIDADMLRGITSPSVFAERLAGNWGEVNVAHSFRDGNVRSQAVFFKQLADEAGWDLDISKLDPQHPESIYHQFLDAQLDFQVNDFDPGDLAKTLTQVITPQAPELQTAPATREVGPASDQVPLKALVAERLRRFPELAPEKNSVPSDHTGFEL